MVTTSQYLLLKDRYCKDRWRAVVNFWHASFDGLVNETLGKPPLLMYRMYEVLPFNVIGACSRSPHTSESNCRFFIYICVYISVVHRSIDIHVGSYLFITIHAPCACTYRRNIEKNVWTSYKCYMNCKVATLFRVLLQEFYILQSFTYFKVYRYTFRTWIPRAFLEESQLTAEARSAGLTVV